MKAEYMALMRLMNNPDYKVLEAIWTHHLTAVEKSRDNAAARGTESAWRYYAGQEKGAKKIITALPAAMLAMESEDSELVGEAKYESLLQEITNGEKK